MHKFKIMDVKRSTIFYIFTLLICSFATISFAQTHKDCSHVHWSYDSATGPANWYKLCDDFAIAQTGKAQSPIDINSENIISIDIDDFDGIGIPDEYDINFSMQNITFGVRNNGHSIEVFPVDTFALTIDNSKYHLQQFHFHSLSEHTLNNKHFPMEVHFVFKSDKNEIVVVGSWIETGKENEAFKEIFANLPKTNQEIRLKTPIDITKQIGPIMVGGSLYSYNGSLTTPPTNENVRWIIFNQPIELSETQIRAFREMYPNNYRPVQPLNGRTVEKL